MKKIFKGLIIVVAGLVILLFIGALLVDDEDDDLTEAETDEYADLTEYQENSDVWGDSEDIQDTQSDELEHENTSDEEDFFTDLWDEDEVISVYPIGSAKELSGNIVVVSIYADDESCTWDENNQEDMELLRRTLEYEKIACDWIWEQCYQYGRDVNFIYDWSQHEDLVYEAHFDENMITNDGSNDEASAQFIDSSVKSIDELKKEYDADNVVYIFMYNTPDDNQLTSCTRNFTLDYPGIYEFCNMYMHTDSEEEAPAAFAHEMLHTFGAPDLYEDVDPEINYNIQEDFVEYIQDSYPNAIMRTTYDVDTNEPYYQYISNDLSPITAYYVGLTDSCPQIEGWDLQESEHVLLVNR